METANFDAELPTSIETASDAITRSGLVFRVGDYPDKQFSLTAEELRQAASDFKPCEGDLEHRPSVLDGKLGRLESVAPSEDGQSLFGVVKEPKWLSDVLGDAPRKVSLAWDKASKRITGMSYVLNPRIPEAAVFGAYAQFSKTEEQNMTTENAALPQDTPKGFMEKLVEWFKGAKPEEIAAFSALAPTPGAATPDPEKEALKAQVAAFTANQATQRTASAKEMAEKLLAANRIVPAQLEAVTAEFSRALDDDAATPKTVTFSVDDGNGAKDVARSRTDCLQAHYEARTAHELTGEQIKEFPPETIAAFNQEATKMRNADETTVNEKQVAEFLAQTSTGQAALAAKRAASNGTAAK